MNFFALTGLANAITSTVLGLFVFFRKKELVNKLFAFFCFVIAFWGYSYYFQDITAIPSEAFILAKLLIAGAIFIPISYLHFVLAFTDSIKSHKKIIWFGYIFFVVIFLLDIFTKLVVRGVGPKLVFEFWPEPGAIFHPFLFIWGSFMIYTVYILIKNYKISEGIKRKQVQLILIGTIIGYLGGATNYFLYYNIPILPIGNWAIVFYLGIVAYVILKYQLFNIKVIATEAITFIIWAFLSIRFLLDTAISERIVDGAILFLVIIFGILLIRSVLKEVSQREEMEKLTHSLEASNIKLSTETRYLTDLQEFTTSIMEDIDFKKVIQAIVDEVSQRFGYIGAVLFLVSDDNKKISPVAVSGGTASKIAFKLLPKQIDHFDSLLEKDATLSSLAIKSNQIEIDEDFSKFFSIIPQNILIAIQKVLGVKTTIAIPVKSKGKAWGVLDVASKKFREEFSSEELDVLTILANQIGIILDNVDLFEQTKQLSSYKTELLSIVAHQLKNPLVVIKGYSSLVDDQTINDIATMKEVFKKIKLSSDKLIMLLNNLLDLHHIEEGKMHYEMQPVELNKMLKDIVDNFQIVAKQRKLNLIFKPFPKDVNINADPYKISQVFQNLIDNSLKYTPEGWVEIDILNDAEENSILVKIFDSGLGMSKELVGKLFQKFSRGVEEQQILGTGLGLYISKEIVEMHGGKIWAESDGEGKGSRFFVKLPIIIGSVTAVPITQNNSAQEQKTAVK